jgi:hypothetical protein
MTVIANQTKRRASQRTRRPKANELKDVLKQRIDLILDLDEDSLARECVHVLGTAVTISIYGPDAARELLIHHAIDTVFSKMRL